MWIDLNAVGIDISKGKSTVTVLQSDGKTIMRARAVSHTVSALNALARDLCALDGETKVVMEHTGRYYEPVAQVLLQAGLFVCAINPLLIKNYNFKKLHAPKTDKADAEKIAHYTLDNWDILQEHNGMDTIRYQLKTLNRQRELNVRNKTTLNNNLVSLLDQCYPDANRLFDSPVRADGTQKWVDFVHTFYMWTASEPSACGPLRRGIRNGAAAMDTSLARIRLRKSTQAPRSCSRCFKRTPAPSC